ncbi:hypothetical protein B296_00038032 [Ensete ventricosum]|uniref:Uncharacterized protein n=1 Tax=Ensete ventricosum TaxID=4639 RepID=A0A426ZXS3_ENSVE|nr:hypothetical protein B296_00038032 [Ensete ventricosum]
MRRYDQELLGAPFQCYNTMARRAMDSRSECHGTAVRRDFRGVIDPLLSWKENVGRERGRGGDYRLCWAPRGLPTYTGGPVTLCGRLPVQAAVACAGRRAGRLPTLAVVRTACLVALHKQSVIGNLRIDRLARPAAMSSGGRRAGGWLQAVLGHCAHNLASLALLLQQAAFAD